MHVSSSALAGISFFMFIPHAAASFVSSLADLNSNDSIGWSQLGTAGAAIPSPFSAGSPAGFDVSGRFATGSGTLAEVCLAINCNFAGAPGLNAGDFLIWTEDANGNGTGPLTITFPRPVQSAGFYFQLTAPSTFVATFTEIAGVNASTESVMSGSGDPIFLGARDPTADITAIIVGGASCTASSPGVCVPSDFAIDRLYVATNACEPAAFVPVALALALLIRGRRGMFKIAPPQMIRCLVGGFLLVFAVCPIEAQDPLPITAGEAALINSAGPALPLPRRSPQIDPVQPADSTPSLPIWGYQITSPVNGVSYSGYMVGTSPFNRGARTTTIPVILVPVIASFTNTTSGFTTTFDPSSAPDVGCTAGQTAMSLVENSPIFQSKDWTLNGVYVGNTQYIDAFQRANFWQYVQYTGSAYHTLLNYSVGDPLALTLQYAAPTPAAEVRTGVQTLCTNQGGSGSTNASAYQGVVDVSTLQDAMTGYIAAHNLTPDQLVIFILYNVMYSQDGLLYLGGYHFTGAPYPQLLSSPGQTYILANFRSNGMGPFDVSILSHEIAEWMDDPGGFNQVPPWGNIGEVTGCKRVLEVGDPLTRTDLPVVVGSNGFAYHLQELAFFSWFFRTPALGAGGNFSNNGSLAADAGALCH